MIIYDFICTAGHRFEGVLASMFDDNPSCAECGGASSRRPARPNIGGVAGTGVPRERMPRSWNALGRGDRDAIAHWHRAATRRERLEERHPELAGDRRPVLAHEGIFRDSPLRAGDDVGRAVGDALRARSAPERRPPPTG